MISWHWFQSSHGTQWHFLPPFISCSVIILFLSKPRHFESKQHHTNTTLHVCFFSFCCEVFFSFSFFVCVALALRCWLQKLWISLQMEMRKICLVEKTRKKGQQLTWERDWGPWKLRSWFLQIRRSVQPALPLRAQQKENCGGKAFILTQLCQHFHPRATDAQSPLWTSSQISGFSAVMQTKSLITIFGLE